MFANFLQILLGRPNPPEEYDLAFIKDVTVRSKPVRQRGVERLMLFCWVMIGLKCWLVTWLIQRYHVPINPLWVIAPTLIFAVMCTFVYWRRE